ncbi:hypothetical protein B2M27_10035 [Kluyvera intermedia]|uniref:Uncharacterized protein n=1 Tax=Kluyvera intermedia TaxID=61648 RepID=A0ABX3UGU5_KLUIN|nr:hypothetical protein [Kluyvera intermedia]ORJ50601.1 hypothetical protein B2M27_10035 [Kluyvera intermedia]
MEDVKKLLIDNGLEICSNPVDNGQVLKVYHNDILCKIAKIDSHPARLTAGYQGMLNDVYKIQAYAELGSKIVNEKLQNDSPVREFRFDDQNHLICSSLYLSAITLYGKCFTSADGRVAQLQETQVLKRMSESQQKKHMKFMDLRHNWTGHGGKSNHELMCGIVAFLPNNTAQPIYPALSIGFSVAGIFEELSELSSILADEIQYRKDLHSADVFKNVDQKEYLHKLRDESDFSLFIETPQPEKKVKVKRK